MGPVVREEAGLALVRNARSIAWSGSPEGGIIGDAPLGAIPLGRLYAVGDSLRRHASKAGVEGMMSIRKSGAEPSGLSQLNLNAAGVDVGASSHFVAVPADRAEQPVREF